MEEAIQALSKFKISRISDAFSIDFIQFSIYFCNHRTTLLSPDEWLMSPDECFRLADECFGRDKNVS